jgi:hypothetical protein
VVPVAARFAAALGGRVAGVAGAGVSACDTSTGAAGGWRLSLRRCGRLRGSDPMTPRCDGLLIESDHRALRQPVPQGA